MAVYDLEEQEQLDDLKAWWARWGNTVATALVVACAGRRRRAGLALVDSAARRRRRRCCSPPWRRPRAPTTSPRPRTRRAQLDRQVRRHRLRAARGARRSRRCSSTPATRAAARAQLQWVVDHADEPELKEIARYRLAELLLNDKQYDEALKMLDAKHGEPFAGLYADLRGDALAAAGRTAEARAAYQDALDQVRRQVAVPQLRAGEARRRSAALHRQPAPCAPRRACAAPAAAPAAPAQAAPAAKRCTGAAGIAPAAMPLQRLAACARSRQHDGAARRWSCSRCPAARRSRSTCRRCRRRRCAGSTIRRSPARCPS